FDYNRKKKWKLKALAATSIAGGFLVFLYEKNWLEAIIYTKNRNFPLTGGRIPIFMPISSR
ncbi:hypothetical protein Q7V69_09480, partial [Streptococcus suis]|nr:hypothetical protein [Streptococcus suis]MDW8652591.1 hypothetical protein [Streptococcus suis]MDW8672472.1 hypothetical protein [Streptococcus suis]